MKKIGNMLSSLKMKGLIKSTGNEKWFFIVQI